MYIIILTLSARLADVAAAIFVIEIEEVFEARMACEGQCLSS